MFIMRTIKADEKPSLLSHHDLNNQGFNGKVYTEFMTNISWFCQEDITFVKKISFL